jgi:nucleotide-binding universal stress UspA family protein
MDTASSATTARHPGRGHTVNPDVVAGLVNDGTAFTVARAAAREAARKGARVRFVQVVEPGLGQQARDDADRATFRAALRAMKGLHGVPCTFEVVEGDPALVLAERSRHAALLVIGRDGPEHDVARRCAHLAECDVLTVTS